MGSRLSLKFVALVILLILVTETGFVSYAQINPIPTKYGDTVDGRAITNQPTVYSFEANVGDSVSVFLKGCLPQGVATGLILQLIDPSGTVMKQTASELTGVIAVIKDVSLEQAGTYFLNVSAYGCTGPFTLKLVGTASSNTSSITTPRKFSGFGFPGLTAVDFSEPKPVDIPLVLDQPILLAIAGSTVYLTKLQGNINDVYVIAISRSSGTASLGFTVLNPANVPIFQVSMGMVDNFTTQVKLTSNGVYNLGFYLSDPNPEASASIPGAYQVTLSKKN